MSLMIVSPLMGSFFYDVFKRFPLA